MAANLPQVEGGISGEDRAAAAQRPSNSHLLLAAPRVTGQYDSSVAVTDVALFAACPRKYFWLAMWDWSRR